MKTFGGKADGARLAMPRLGEAFEPARVERAEPWWRTVDSEVQPLADPGAPPKTVPWPLD
jgi:hypothetical protein